MLRRALMLAVLAGALAAPATAQADAFKDVFADYQKDGKIDPCAHSQADLRAAKGKVPNDIEQYAPDFPDALDAALEDRARTECGETAGATATTPNPTATAPAATTPTETVPSSADELAAGIDGGTTTVPGPPGTAQPADAASDGAIVNAAQTSADRGADDIPAPLIALAVLGGLLLLALLVWGVARFFAWDPAWAAESRHAIAEAGWRAGGLWDDFTDWLRPGRRGGPAA